MVPPQSRVESEHLMFSFYIPSHLQALLTVAAGPESLSTFPCRLTTSADTLTAITGQVRSGQTSHPRSSPGGHTQPRVSRGGEARLVGEVDNTEESIWNYEVSFLIIILQTHYGRNIWRNAVICISNFIKLIINHIKKNILMILPAMGNLSLFMMILGIF